MDDHPGASAEPKPNGKTRRDPLIHRICRARTFWYFIGLFTPPIFLNIWGGIFGFPARDVIPFTGIIEYHRKESFIPTDYDEVIRSSATQEEFERFVRRIRLEKHKISDTEYSKGDGRTQIGQRARFEDGWIHYHEWAD